MNNIKLKKIVEVVVDNKENQHGDKRQTQQVLAQRYKNLIGKIYRHFKGVMFPMPGEYFRPTDSSGSVGTVGTPINMERE